VSARRPAASPTPVKNEWEWHWRSVAAVIYLIICATDFVIMPLYREYSHNKLTPTQIMEYAQAMEGSNAQVEALRIWREDRPWTPLTNEVFHLAFGAILGVSALPQNRRANIRRREEDTYEESPYREMEGDGMPPRSGRMD
jgi:N-dimethylarginine dimethylaminohydrolase